MSKASWFEFRRDLSKAREVEMEIEGILQRDSLVSDIESNDDNRYDLKLTLSNGNILTIEIKTDYMAARTGNVAIEYESRGKASGIVATQADLYWIRIHEPSGEISDNLITVEKLRKMIDDKLWFKNIIGGDKSSKARCYIFKIDVIKDNSIRWQHEKAA